MSFNFDEFERLVEIVYLGKVQISHKKYQKLIGLNKSYFNSMFELY